MKEKTLRFLEAHESHEASSFVDEAKWRQENNAWIRWSQSIALKIVDFMQENNLSRADIAERLGCTPQYVSKILSGKTNFSFKTIAEIERRLGISCMEKRKSRKAPSKKESLRLKRYAALHRRDFVPRKAS